MKALMFAALCASAAAFAQESKETEKNFQQRAAQSTVDTVKTFGWKLTMATGLNLSQVSFRDWVGGGENALAYSIWLNCASTL